MMHVYPLPPEARRRAITGRLARGEPVRSVALAQEFEVSEDAIRRDLRALSAQGVCRRVYGGALPISPASGPFAAREAEDVGRKIALARAACDFLRPEATLFLDTGSTVLRLAELLPQAVGLGVVTNSIPAAAALAARTDLSLTIIGGSVDPSVGGCVDARAAFELESLRVDICFLGACAISCDRGLAGFHPADVAFKRRLVEVSAEVVVMLTNEKIDTAAPFGIGPVENAPHLVLEHDAPAGIVDRLHRRGHTIRIADAPRA
jgi:DeoR/GlpR family transcriptional regulator of sugar metabolism